MNTVWNEHSIELFNKHVGKMYDCELANMLGCYERTVTARRKQLGIEKFVGSKYPEAVIKYILENYKTKGNLEIALYLNKLYPDIRINESTVKNILFKFDFRRTDDDLKFIRQQPFSRGRKSAATAKRHEQNGPKIGDIVYTYYSTRHQWCIKLGPMMYAPYAKYLWLKHYDNIPGGMRADWIDPDGPLIIDNIKLIKFIGTKLPIGGVTNWKHEGRVRELIKVAEGEYQLLLPYLWRKHKGEIPPGQWVKKIDESKPTTIENLHLVQQTFFAEGTKNLDDWYIAGLLSRNTTPEARAAIKNDRDLIEMKRMSVEATRNINEFEHGTRNTQPGQSASR